MSSKEYQTMTLQVPQAPDTPCITEEHEPTIPRSFKNVLDSDQQLPVPMIARICNPRMPVQVQRERKGHNPQP